MAYGHARTLASGKVKLAVGTLHGSHVTSCYGKASLTTFFQTLIAWRSSDPEL